jgi:hypothetical protein
MRKCSRPNFDVPASIKAAREREKARGIPEHEGIMTYWWNVEAHLLGVAARARFCGLTREQFVALIRQAWAHEVADPAGIVPSTHPEREPEKARLARLRHCACRLLQ